MYLAVPIDLLPLLVAAATVAVLLIRAGVGRVRRDQARGRSLPPNSPEVAQGTDAPYIASFGSSLLDIEREALGALRHVDGLAARNRVRLQIAVQPDLAVRADPRGLRQALIGLLENAIRHAPGGKIMLSGMRHGGRIQIAVLDDGQGPDRLAQEASLRSVERIVALHGGTLQVECRPGQGTLVLLRLPEPLSAPANSAPANSAPAKSAEAAEPASKPTQPIPEPAPAPAMASHETTGA